LEVERAQQATEAAKDEADALEGQLKGIDLMASTDI
jgi:hypothetical protein